MPFKERRTPTTKVEVVKELVPTIFIDSEAITKMGLYVEECEDEIGWLGTVSQHGRNFLIEDVFLFEQDVHATTTEITPEGLTEFAEELLAKEDGMEVWNKLKMWGHSHVNMGLTPSGQDDSQMETFKEGGHDWFIRLIANKKGELKIDIYDYKAGVAYLDMPWCVNPSAEERKIEEHIEELYALLDELQGKRVENYKEDIKVEMKAKVRKKVSKLGTVYSTYSKTNNTQVRHNAYVNNSTYQQAWAGYGGWDDEVYDEFDITSDDDVLDFFVEDDLLILSTATDLHQLEELISHINGGYNQGFTMNEMEIILRVALKSTMNTEETKTKGSVK